MNNKGSAFGELLGWIIAIAVLVLLITMFFIGPQAFFMKIKSVIPSANMFQNVGTGTTPDYETRSDTEQALDLFTELTLGFGELAQDEANYCFYFLPKDVNYKKLFDDFNIEIVEAGNGAAFYLRRDISSEGETYSDPTNSIKIDDMELCLVYGEPVAENFYTNWLVKKDDETSKKEPEVDIKPQTKLTLDYEKIIVGDEKIKWRIKDGGRYVIYKRSDAEKNYVCLIATRNVGRNCKTRIGGYLDDDCFTEEDDALAEMLKKQEKALVWTVETGQCEPVK